MDASKAHFYAPAGRFFVEGADSAHFLQGQFSQDLRGEAGSCFYGLWLNHKGKIKADSFLLKLSERRFLVMSYFGETQSLRDNLEGRIIMDEVETKVPEKAAKAIVVWGASIDSALDVCGMDRPGSNEFRSNGDVYAFWGRRGNEENLEIVDINGSIIDKLKQRFLSDGVQLLNSEAIDHLALTSGRFQVGKDILESDLPQEVGLAESAVSYAKGCYIGQEVMARLKSMGRPRRSLECVSVSDFIEGGAPWDLVTADGVKAGELRRVVEGEEPMAGSAMIKKSVEDRRLFLVEEKSDIRVERLARGTEA